MRQLFCTRFLAHERTVTNLDVDDHRIKARRALETAQAYVNTRESFGSRLADLQQIQAMVADSHIDLHASRLMTLDCAGRMDAGLSVKQHSAMTKVFVSEAVNRVADRAVQMMGASGLSDDTLREKIGNARCGKATC